MGACCCHGGPIGASRGVVDEVRDAVVVSVALWARRFTDWSEENKTRKGRQTDWLSAGGVYCKLFKGRIIDEVFDRAFDDVVLFGHDAILSHGA